MKERKKDSNKSEEKARIGFFAGFQLRCKNPTNNEATKLEKHVLEKNGLSQMKKLKETEMKRKEKNKSLCRNNQRRNRKLAVFEQLLSSLKILLKKRCCYFGS